MRRLRLGMAALGVLVGLVVAPLTAAHAAPPQATFAYALTATNRLVLFNVATPGTILRNVQITGLQTGEAILGIDSRPATGELFALGSTSRLYIVDPVTGAATAVGGPFTPTLSGTSFGFDFNPTVDRIRVVSDVGQNLRLNPNNGTVAGNDLMLNNGPAAATGAAYTNNFPGAAATMLYDIDSTSDSLYVQNPPNNGTLVLIGALGVDFTQPNGFDIVTVNGVDSAYAALTPPASLSSLYTVNLSTGAATSVGTIGGGEVIRGLAVATGALVCTVPPGNGVIFATPNTITVGTAGNDVICGTSGDDRIAGLGGDDLILGLGGNDQLSGGEGADTIYGGPGNDSLAGGPGADFLFGDAGNDDLSGGPGNDSLYGNDGADRLAGSEDTDLCRPANAVTPDAGDVAAPAPSCETVS